MKGDVISSRSLLQPCPPGGSGLWPVAPPQRAFLDPSIQTGPSPAPVSVSILALCLFRALTACKIRFASSFARMLVGVGKDFCLLCPLLAAHIVGVQRVESMVSCLGPGRTVRSGAEGRAAGPRGPWPPTVHASAVPVDGHISRSIDHEIGLHQQQGSATG